MLTLQDGTELRGDRLLVATGRKPRTESLGAETGEHGEIPVDSRMNAGERLWAVGDCCGIWPLTYVAKYQARVAAANILGGERHADYSAVPRVVFTDPQAASVGEAEAELSATVELASVPRTSTYLRDYNAKPGLPHPALRRRADHRRPRARPRGRRMAPAGDARHPRTGAAGRPWPT